MKKIELSVHQLVDFLLRSGDIDSRIFNRATMSEGSKIHSWYQGSQRDNYLSEYPLQTTLVINEIEITIQGRADGIICNPNDEYIIDEIKSTVAKIEDYYKENEPWHLGQAKVYAYMFAKERNLKQIGIKLTYIEQTEDKNKRIFDYSFDIYELEQYLIDLIEQYLEFYRIIDAIRQQRNASIAFTPFPYKDFRKGQKELIKYAFGIASKGGTLFVEAPTGIGKTISTLYPFIKTFPFDDESKIFYLTAKTSGKDSASNAIDAYNKQGGKISYLVMTAKDKICFCKDKACNPDECIFAKNYYSKIANVIKYAIITFPSFDFVTITSIAKEFEICPFEFELDISMFIDVVICDYNYMFDPLSHMHRYFDESTLHYLALIDESHNLVDRSRDMYSESFSESMFIEARKSLRKTNLTKLKSNFSKLGKMFNEYKNNLSDEYIEQADLDEDLLKILSRFLDIMVEINKEHSKDVTPELLEFYLKINRFMKIYELVDDNYAIFIKKCPNDVCIHLLCLDASKYIREINRKLKGSVFFSATLSPVDYYIDTLGGDKYLEPVLMLPSPFPRENFKIIVAPKVSIKYRNRENTYSTVVEYIKSFISGKIGNYFVYVPSYEYLEKLLPLLNFGDEIVYYVQNREMSELEKEEFVSNFITNPSKITVGFCIIGGSFSEGIDLVSDRLIGAVIVGIGMPKINFESNLIAKYYENKGYNGNDYAYLYPGMNKVMQAVGRVIRDENDKGAVLLIDERYALNSYRDLFKKEWKSYEIALSSEDVKEIMHSFYENEKI